jgi:hypothetical protein
MPFARRPRTLYPGTMTKALPWLILLLVASASPVRADADPASIPGFWGLGPTRDDQTCDMEFLAAIADEFEGVWQVARPLHYEDNRAACRLLGVDDVIAWSMPEAGDRIWLLAEGEAGLMEFVPGRESMWAIARSGHGELPRIVLEKKPRPLE